MTPRYYEPHTPTTDYGVCRICNLPAGDCERANADRIVGAGGFPRLPEMAAPEATDTLQSYGCKVLAFVLVENCTATLSDEQLHLADHAYPVAIGARDIEPTAVDRLTVARHRVLAALRARHVAEVPPVSLPALPLPDRPNEGPMARLEDVPIVRPPSPVKVDIAF